MILTILSTIACAASATTTTNPLLAKWSGPYGGLPPYDKVKVADMIPALEEGMAQKRAEIEKIANNKEEPTFENTILELERSGETFAHVQETVYGTWSQSMKTPEFQKSKESEMSPKLAAFNDEIAQNSKLFARIEAVYNSPAKAKLTPIQQRFGLVVLQSFLDPGCETKCCKAKEESGWSSIKNWRRFKQRFNKTFWRTKKTTRS